MNAQPTVIRKHWFGLTIILLVGILVESSLVLAMYALFYQDALTLTLYVALSAIIIVVVNDNYNYEMLMADAWYLLKDAFATGA